MPIGACVRVDMCDGMRLLPVCSFQRVASECIALGWWAGFWTGLGLARSSKRHACTVLWGRSCGAFCRMYRENKFEQIRIPNRKFLIPFCVGEASTRWGDGEGVLPPAFSKHSPSHTFFNSEYEINEFWPVDSKRDLPYIQYQFHAFCPSLRTHDLHSVNRQMEPHRRQMLEGCVDSPGAHIGQYERWREHSDLATGRYQSNQFQPHNSGIAVTTSIRWVPAVSFHGIIFLFLDPSNDNMFGSKIRHHHGPRSLFDSCDWEGASMTHFL